MQILESISLSSTKTLDNIYIWIPAKSPSRDMSSSHVRFLNTGNPNCRHAKGRTGHRKGSDTRIEYRDLPILQNYLRYLLSCFYPKNRSSGSLKSFLICSTSESLPFRSEFTWSRCVYSTPSELSAILCVLFGDPLRAVFSNIGIFPTTAKFSFLQAGVL